MVDEWLPTLFLVQRCEVYGLWPEQRWGSKQIKKKCSFSDGSLRDVDLNVLFVFQKNRPNFSSPAKVVDHPIKLISWGKSTGFWASDSVFIEDKVGEPLGQIVVDDLKEGEVDILISPCGLEESEAVFCLRQIEAHMTSLILLIGLRLQEVIKPRGVPQLIKRDSNNFQCLTQGEGIRLISKPRSHVTHDSLVAVFAEHGDVSYQQTTDTTGELGIAARRILSALTETDVVDKFCDLWEACEFLSKARKHNIETRVANLLSEATGIQAVGLKDCIVKPIYRIRCNIVHNAVENSLKLSTALPVLQEIANCLFLWKFQCGIVNDSEFVRLLRNSVSSKNPFV